MPSTVWDVLFSTGLRLRDIIAPARCIGCLQENVWVCNGCRQSLLAVPQWCIVCNQDTTGGRTCFTCRDETALHGALSAGLYSNAAIRRGVHWLKFKGVTSVTDTLASFLIPYLSYIAPLSILPEEAVLVPIPLHPRRRRMRGFNQSDLIAVSLSTFTSIPVKHLLYREKATQAQATLPHPMRQYNMSRAFTPLQPTIKNKDCENKKYFILIDDVVTSGATLDAAACALSPTLPNGAELWAATIARG